MQKRTIDHWIEGYMCSQFTKVLLMWFSSGSNCYCVGLVSLELIEVCLRVAEEFSSLSAWDS